MAYHLVSIGISAYSNPSNNLGYPDKDAGELSAIMRHSLGSELTYDVLLRDNEATQIAIRTALSADILKKASANDTLIIFYSGHGAVAENDSGEPEAYLAPYDVDGSNVAISGVSTTEIKILLDNLQHGNKIVLLDCCYSGDVNTKSINRVKNKDLSHIKAFQNIESYAEGTFVFTACKEDEKAIELAELEHGLFTYYLLDSLVSAKGDDVPLSDLHNPVTKSVEAKAKEYSCTQTPTIKISAKGSMSLPKLNRPPALKPELIKVPTTQNERPATVAAPKIDVSNKKAQEVLQSTIRLVEGVAHTKLDQIAFRSTLGKVLATVKEAHESQTNHIRTNDELATLIANLEAKSFQLLVTSAAVAVAGDDQAIKIFSEEVAQMLAWKQGQNGSVAAIATSDVIFLAILYIVFVCSIYTDDYKPIGKILNTHAYDGRRGSYMPVVGYYEIHFADALGGNAQTTIKHMVELLTSQVWLYELLGVDKVRLEGLISQANLCMSVAISRRGAHAYPGYNDFDLGGIAPLVNRIRTDTSTQASMATHVFDVSVDEIPQLFAREVANLNSRAGGHWWRYLKPEAFTQETSLTDY